MFTADISHKPKDACIDNNGLIFSTDFRMEDSKNSRENSPSSPSSSLDSSKYEIRARINPLHINNVTNGDDQDASTKKHYYSRARGILVRSSKSPNSPNRIKEINPSRSLIDTTVPFESVKAAVNMFRGTVDWKTHRLLTKELKKTISQEFFCQMLLRYQGYTLLQSDTRYWLV